MAIEIPDWDAKTGDTRRYDEATDSYVPRSGTYFQVIDSPHVGLFGNTKATWPKWNIFQMEWQSSPQPQRGYLTSDSTARMCELINAELERQASRARVVPFMQPAGQGASPTPPVWCVVVKGQEANPRKSNAGELCIALCNYGITDPEAGALKRLSEMYTL